MSDLSRRSGEGAKADDLDHVIDDVARRMTEGAAPIDMRDRIMAQLATNRDRRTTNGPGSFVVHGSWFGVRGWMWAPIAAAALIIVAVFVARDRGPRNDRDSQGAAHQQSGPPIARAQSATPAESPRADGTLAAKAPATRGSTSVRRARSAASEIDALAPSPIETPSIDVDAMTTESIEIPPLETIDPIPVAPLATPEGERP